MFFEIGIRFVGVPFKVDSLIMNSFIHDILCNCIDIVNTYHSVTMTVVSKYASVSPFGVVMGKRLAGLDKS